MRVHFETDIFYTTVVHEISQLINESVIFTNENGIIVASTDETRLGSFHEGALKAIKKKQMMNMTEELVHTLQGVRKGVVIPILIENHPLGAIGITGDPKVVGPYALIVQKVTELLVQNFITQRNQEKQIREVEFFIFDWLNSRNITKSLLERSKLFNIQMENFKQIIIFKINEASNQLSYNDINTLKRFWDRDQKALFVRWGQDKILILIGQYEKKLLKLKLKSFVKKVSSYLGLTIHVGVGQPNNFTHLHQSLEQAERACEVAVKQNRIIFEDELRFDLLLHGLDDDTKKEFIKRTIAPIENDQILIETLEAWFNHNMSNQRAAKELHIHKNTLHYRLKKIEELTQLNLKIIHHLVILYTGYRFLKLSFLIE